jgi:(2Fe-2S) ferredoxin
MSQSQEVKTITQPLQESYKTVQCGPEEKKNIPGLNIFKKHVFVCTEGKTCPNQGSKEVFTELRSVLSASENPQGIRINKSGCLGMCGNGPMVVVYPDGVWYSQVTTADCKDIVEEHLVRKQVVERLVYGNKPA